MRIKSLLALAFIGLLLSSCAKQNFYSFNNPANSYQHKAKAVVTEENTELAELAQASEELLVSAENNTLPSAKAEGLKKTAAAIEKQAVASKKVTKLEEAKAAIALKKEVKAAVKEIKKVEAAEEAGAKGKSQLIAAILAFVGGFIGIHRFYLGYTTIGILQILTVGGCGIWSLIDLVRILMGDLKPKGGDYAEKL